MCVVLANLSYEQTDLNPMEKHILLILCIRADPKTKLFWTSIDRIKMDSGYSLNTIEKAMKSLRDKKKITQTGNKKGKMMVTPEYKVTIISTPAVRGDLSLVTPPEMEVPPPEGGSSTPTTWGIERAVERSLKKGGFLNSSTPKTQKEVSKDGALHISNILKDLGVRKLPNK